METVERLGELLGDPSALAVADAFTEGLPVTTEALAPLDAQALAAEGLLRRTDGQWKPTVRLTPWQGLVLAHDPDPPGLPRDWVGGPNDAARLLAAVTVRRPVEAVLDLGTGCGIQALLAARHARRVVAVDINPHAVELARLSARLNRAANVECREGDLFGSVAGETFDLVVANPPFVVSPDADFLYRDAPDDVCARIAREAPAHLRPGGFACMLCHWGTRRGEGRFEPVRRWVDGNGCDALVLAFGFERPFPYAASWTEPPATADAAAHAAATERWVAHYREEGIEAIWLGAVVLRRRERGASWLAALDAPEDATGTGGEQVLRIVVAQDVLVGSPDLLALVLEPPAGHRLVHVLTRGDRGYELRRAALEADDSAGLRGDVEPLAVHVLLQLDGRRTLGEAVEAAAAERGLDTDLLREASLRSARRLLERGFLVSR